MNSVCNHLQFEKTLTFRFFWKNVTTPAYWRPIFRRMALSVFMALSNVFANIVDQPKNQLDINVLVDGNKKVVQISTFKLNVL